MNHLGPIALVFAAISMPAAASVSVETAAGDWSKLPQLSQRGYEHLSEKMQAKLYEIAGSGHCPSFALSHDRLDLKISFAVQYDGSGGLARVILPKLDCAEAESVVGGTLLEMLQAGDYAATGKSPNGWYQGALGFSFAGESALQPAVAKPAQQGQQIASNIVDPNEIICERAEEIGTRLVTKRVCMSRAQWAEQKRLTRQMIEQMQTQRPCKDTC